MKTVHAFSSFPCLSLRYKQAPDAWRLLTNVMDAVAVLLRCARRYLARKRDRYPFRGHKVRGNKFGLIVLVVFCISVTKDIRS